MEPVFVTPFPSRWGRGKNCRGKQKADSKKSYAGSACNASVRELVIFAIPACVDFVFDGAYTARSPLQGKQEWLRYRGREHCENVATSCAGGYAATREEGNERNKDCAVGDDAGNPAGADTGTGCGRGIHRQSRI